MPWQLVAVDVPVMVLYALAVVWVHRQVSQGRTLLAEHTHQHA